MYRKHKGGRGAGIFSSLRNSFHIFFCTSLDIRVRILVLKLSNSYRCSFLIVRRYSVLRTPYSHQRSECATSVEYLAEPYCQLHTGDTRTILLLLVVGIICGDFSTLIDIDADLRLNFHASTYLLVQIGTPKKVSSVRQCSKKIL